MYMKMIRNTHCVLREKSVRLGQSTLLVYKIAFLEQSRGGIGDVPW